MIKIRLLLCALSMAFAVQVNAQSLVAYHVVGNVTYTANGTTKPLVMNTTVSNSTSINIPYGGKLELLNEKSKQRITLTTPGNGTIAQMASAKGNSVTELSEHYVAYVKRQLTNKGLTSQQRYSDFATVTRERDSLAATPHTPTMQERFAETKRKQREKFRAFRAACNAKYTEFVRQAWEKMGKEPPVERPQDQEVRPEVINDTTSTARFLFFGRKKKEAKTEDIMPAQDKQPQPVEAVKEIEVPAQEKQFSTMPFVFLGKELSVRLDETKRIELGQITPNRIADALQYLGSEDYDNLLYDCLALRKSLQLCDWAYLLMLQDVTDQFCGEGTNEAALLLGYLLYQSGYKMRFETDNTNLYVLVAIDCSIFGKPYCKIDNEKYYAVEDDSASKDLYFCKAAFPKESVLSLQINQQMKLDKDETAKRAIKAADYENFGIDVSVNEHLLDFYNKYPSSYTDDNQLTRWMDYAEAPMSSDVQEQVYPQLRNQLEGMNELDAVNHLLNLVQTGLQYEFDEKIWGYDRTFFTEESLYYPFCDCEDRSILFTRLVRDLLGLDCVLIYYPGHLASAVHFTEDVPGDYYTFKDKSYTVCDATYIHAGVGKEMNCVAGKPATLIPLK